MGYTGTAGGTTYPLNISYIQTFKPTCSGNLSSIVAGPFNNLTDDLRGSTYYVVARIRSATGTILATSARTDQIYNNGPAVTFDFSCNNVYLTSGTTYQMELYESTGTTQLYLLSRTTSDQYTDGFAILDGTSFPAADIRNLRAVVASTSLASAAITKTQDVSCGLFTNASSQIIAQVSPGTISGNTTAKLFFEGTQPAQFVTRHYEINPASNASSATGNVTLYFTQAEFNAFNAVSSVKLPTGPSDNTGIANLLIERRIGTSSNGTGLPLTYSGATQTINPSDPSIVWNSAASRWEVTFNVTGFGGFFVKTQTIALPVTLSYFNGRMTEAGALMSWQTASETNNARFSIERSRDVISFEVIGNVTSLAPQGNSGTSLTYSFTDIQPLPGINYYRLTQTDYNGTRTLHKVIALSRENQPPVLYPNPVGTLGEATLEPALAYTRYELTDMQGRVRQQVGEPGTLSTLSVGSLPAGVYVLRVQTSAGAVVFRLVR